jgi:hypothetical protein
VEAAAATLLLESIGYGALRPKCPRAYPHSQVIGIVGLSEVFHG